MQIFQQRKDNLVIWRTLFMSIHATRDLRHINKFKRLNFLETAVNFPSIHVQLLLLTLITLLSWNALWGDLPLLSAVLKVTENTVWLFICNAFDAIILLLQATGTVSLMEHAFKLLLNFRFARTLHQAAVYFLKASSWCAFYNNRLLKKKKK